MITSMENRNVDKKLWQCMACERTNYMEFSFQKCVSSIVFFSNIFSSFIFLLYTYWRLIMGKNGVEAMFHWNDECLCDCVCVCVFVLLVHVHLNKLLLVWWLNVCVLLSEWYFRFFICEKCIYKLNRDERRAREDGQYYSLNESHYFLFLLQCETHTHRK